MSALAFEDSGKVVKPSIEELLAADNDSAIIAYTDGIAEDGRPYYAYIAVKPSMYEEFHALTSARKPIVLEDYGTILAGDYAASAPPSVKQAMRETYGFDENFIEKIKENIMKMGKVFFEKKEDNRIMDIVGMLQKQNKKPA